MIIDNELTIAKDLAFDGTPTNVYIGKNSGSGTPLYVYVAGKGLTGATGFTINHSDDDQTYDYVTVVVADIVDDKAIISLPSDIKQYVNVSVNGSPTAGTWNACIVLDAQTAV